MALRMPPAYILFCLLSALFIECSQQFSDGQVPHGVCSWDAHSSPFPRREKTCPLPIDESTPSRKGGWSPWSYRPYCVVPDKKPDTQYCVFTTAPFRNHGMSLVTTPELAASVANALDDSIVPHDLRDHPSSSLSSRPGQNSSYEIKELPGRGKGAVATRKISRWEVVMVGFPAIMAQMDFLDVMSEEQAEEVLEVVANRLPKETREVIFGLAKSSGGDPLVDVLLTNIFGLDINEIWHMGLFLEGSVSCLGMISRSRKTRLANGELQRVNHKCKPKYVLQEWVESTIEANTAVVPIGATHPALLPWRLLLCEISKLVKNSLIVVSPLPPSVILSSALLAELTHS